MDVSAAKPELDITLDVFGQRLVPVFTQIGFCFPIPDGFRVEDISDILNRGAERLAEHFPWVAGQVVCQGATESNTGTFKIKSLEAKPRVWVKDIRGDPSFPSWDALEQSNFPMHVLDENIVAPRKTTAGPSESIPAEVFQLQATIIKGGLILTFLGQHQAMDGTGQARVISLFSKACRNEIFTEEELRNGNLASENLVRTLGDDWTPGPELEYIIIKQESSQPGPGRVQGPMAMELGVWSYFNFSASALRELKSQATQTLPPNLGYITTDDALTAFIWQSVARARLPRYGSTTEALFARAVDLRRYLDISETHPGVIQNMTYHNLSLEQVTNSSLGVIAANFRAALDPKTSNLAYSGRSLATLISRTPDKRFISFLSGCDLARDVMLSSWANQNSYRLDFGLGLGRPQAVRRPLFDSLPGLAYFMPKSPDGDIGVAICLSADDTERLRTDSEVLKHATHIG
ncbi:putative trichothecene 3-O-acetyltransferase [Xylaria cf. heliscus]|nr:putative trichothecene 3-O-acetyltransferase [Xylaria cf. heliscus]